MVITYYQALICKYCKDTHKHQNVCVRKGGVVLRLKGISQCEEGDILGRTVYDISGRPLIVEDLKLTSPIIDKLKKISIHILYIKDEETEDIDIEDSIPIELKQEAISKITETFTKLQDTQADTEKILLQEVKAFKGVISSVFHELQGNQKALNMMTSLQVSDHYVYQHSFNVMVYSVQMMIHLQESQKRSEEIGLGAILHDIGKMKIPKEVLEKPGKLTAEEYAVVQEHCQIGFDMLRKQYSIPLVAAHCAYQHHERVDGSGYPRGLLEKDMHFYAKIMGVCDVFDAVTTNRSYRAAMLPSDGMELLYAGCGQHFNQEMVDTFKHCVALYPEGLEVVLSNGERGVVKEYDLMYPGRPVVKVLKDEEGAIVSSGLLRDLRNELNLTIVESKLLF